MASISRNEWFVGKSQTSLDKTGLITTYRRKFYSKLSRMFEYKNLPDTIPQRDLELILLRTGYAIITEVNNKLYAFSGSLGGAPNPYYLPTIAVVANPALNYSKSLKIDEDCILFTSDSMWNGIGDLIDHASILLAECDLSFKFMAVNSRVPALIAMPDSQSAIDANTILKSIENGSDIAVLTDTSFYKDMKSLPYNNSSNSVKDLIELKQYIYGSLLQDLGIKAPFNMKREAINEAEAALSDDLLLPLIDDMMYNRKQCIDKINAKYGTNISIEFSSAWKNFRKRLTLADDLLEAEINNLENPQENNEEEKEVESNE